MHEEQEKKNMAERSYIDTASYIYIVGYISTKKPLDKKGETNI